MDILLSYGKNILGIDVNELSILHIMVRCIIIYTIGIGLVRFGKKRFIGKMSAFDTILAIIIGSLLSRAITETELFLQILAACFFMILIHRLLSLIASYSDKFGNYIKGHERVVVKDGEILWKQMRKSNLSKQDLMQNIRLNANITEVEKIKMACLERNGDISVILNKKEE